jgi:hypothetical protein
MHGMYMLLPAGLDFSRFAHLDSDLYGLYGLGRRSRGVVAKPLALDQSYM